MSGTEHFLRAEWLPVLLLVPVVGLVLWALDRRRARRLADLAGPRTPLIAAELSPARRRARRVLVTAALAFAGVAAMQPVWGEVTRKIEQRGVDVLVCLDVSRSMLARDVAPSRLLRARTEIRALADRARGDRLGLVVFAGEARLAVPLTRDGRSFAELADQADPLSVARGGTDLGAALRAALAAIGGTAAIGAPTARHATIVVLTDGEDADGGGLRAARACKDRGVVVHCVGLGSARGAKIAIAGDGGESYLRDRAGNDVVSAMDAAALRRIADATGGAFVDASATPRALVGLYDERIVTMARTTFEAEERRERGNRFQWPLAAACALWLLDLSLSDRGRR